MSLFTLFRRFALRGHTIHILCERVHRDKLKFRRLKKQLRGYQQIERDWAITLHACLAIRQQFSRLIAENEHLRIQVARAEEMSYAQRVAELQARVHELTLQRRALLKTQWTPPDYYNWPPLRKLLEWRVAYLRWRGDRGARV